MKIDGYRNMILGFAFLATCAWMVHLAGPDNIKDTAAPIGSMGLGVAGVAGARAFKALAEKKKR